MSDDLFTKWSLAQGPATQHKIKAAPGDWGQIEFKFWQNIHDTTMVPYRPYRYLPALYEAIVAADGGLTRMPMVIPKGRIVGGMDVHNTGAIASGTNGIVTQVADAGTVVVGEDINGNAISVLMTNDSKACGHDCVSLIVPCNNGVGQDYSYTALDVTHETIAQSTQKIVTAGLSETCHIPGVYPIGVMDQPVMGDLRGANINYNPHDMAYALHVTGMVEVPFVNTNLFDADATCVGSGAGVTFGTDADAWSGGATKVYDNLFKSFSFLWTTQAADLESKVYLKSDRWGCWMAQYDNATTAATAQYRTKETVGYIEHTDCVYPKGALKMVLTKPGSRLPGTGTQGIEPHLYYFAAAAMLAGTGSTPTTTAVLDAIQSGVFGTARIALTIK